MIIIEGIDGVGKTTMAAEYCVVYPNYTYIHNFVKAVGDRNIMSEANKELLLMTYVDDVVMDRSYIISEFVYSQVLGRHSPITYEHMLGWAELTNQREHGIQYLRPASLAVLTQKDEDANLPLGALLNAYDKLFKDLPLKNLVVEEVDYSEEK